MAGYDNYYFHIREGFKFPKYNIIITQEVCEPGAEPPLGLQGQPVHRHLGPGVVSSARHHHVVWHLYSTSFPGGSDD